MSVRSSAQIHEKHASHVKCKHEDNMYLMNMNTCIFVQCSASIMSSDK